MNTRKRSIGTALKSSVAAEEEAVRKRFDQADQLLVDRREALSRAEGGATTSSALVPKDQETLDLPVGVTRLAYSLPPHEAVMVQEMLLRAAQAGQLINRSELVRAALQVLSVMPDAAFDEAVKSVVKLKPGRPAVN